MLLLFVTQGKLLAHTATVVEFLQQQSTITGRVTSESDNEPIPGVNILIKGTSLGSMTDVDGRYTLEIPSRDAVLVFSAIGYESQEVSVGGRTSIDVSLVVSITALQEILVVGYGTQEKVTVTNAVSQINGEELLRRPVTSLQQAMQGQMPGITILDRGGSPSSPNTQILVRGVNKPYTPVGLAAGAISQVGNNNPLVIVDGIEQQFQNINPEDIETITVLKDASSTAIYGSRAANGVLLITTKRAKAGKVSVSYSGFYAIQKAISKPEHMDIESYLELQKIAYANVGGTPPASLPQYTDAGRPVYVAGTKSDPLKYPLPYDWYNQLFQTAPQTNHTLSVSGGSEDFKGRLSLRSQEQDGIIPNVKSKLTDIRLNSDYKVSDKINISGDLNYRFTDDLEPTGINNLFRFMMQNAIWAVPKYPNGVYGGGTQGWNPLLLAEKGGTNQMVSNYLLGSIKGEIELAKGLSFSSQVAVRSIDARTKNYVNTWETRDSTVVKRANLINSLTEARNNFREVTINNLLNYSVNIGDHSIKALLGYSQFRNESNSLNAYRQNFYNNDVTSINQGTNDPTKDNGGRDIVTAMRSYFSRINYAFKSKYLFEANARYDGSSLFVKSNRYSFFPSFSAGWRISEEGFWDGLRDQVSSLKVRASWGETGNQAVDPYSYFSSLSPVTYNFNNTIVQGFRQTTLADPDLIWETTSQIDIGLDAEFYEGQLVLNIDYYKKRTDGIHLQLPVPGALGLGEGFQNAGVVENRGWEFVVGTRHKLGAFQLNSNLNFNINNNEVIDLAGSGPYINGNDIDPRYITEVGYPINAFWGYQTDGLYQTQEQADNDPVFMRAARPGDVRMVDRNEDGAINAADMTFLGNSFPKYTFGGTINLAYKAFTLNIALQGAADVGMRIARALGEQGNFEGFTPDIYTDNYWTPERTNARFPRPTKQDLRNQASTDRMIVDASYLRVKNIQLAYQIPSELTRRIFVERARVFVSGTNLITISKLNEWNLDPEASSGWQNYYPQTSLYTLGINLQF
jgi:TonB-linked SusC/RagA family outer membrane protein